MTLNRINILVLIFWLVSVAVTGCKEQKPPSSSSTDIKQYHLSIKGTSGVQLEMMCVYKPTSGTLDRRQKRISVPYSENISATRYYVWVDTLPEGASGNEGDKYTIELTRDGNPIATGGPFSIKKANQYTSGSGDL